MKIRFTALALVALLVVSGLTLAAFAQEATTADQIVLTVAPMRLELKADPGESLEATVAVTNSSGRALNMTTEVTDFVAEEGGETPRFVPSSEVSPWSMSPWVRIEPSTFVLEPGEKGEVTVVTVVPEDAEPGGHYAAVLFSSTTADAQGTGVVSKVGSLILLSVSGDIVESGQVSLNVPRLLEKGPVPFGVEFANDGNVHVKPEGTIIVSRWRGDTLAELPIGGENVLPDSQRSFEASWTEASDFGIFSARAVMDYGEGLTTESQRITFFIAPWKLILGIIVVFAVGITAGLFMRRKKE